MSNKFPINPNKEYLLSQLSKGNRVDGRGLEDYRPITIEFGVAGKADGSASVKLGNTYVLAGVKAEIGKPFSDTPDEGVLLVNSEFVPFASPEFDPGPPDENSIELARVVDRGLRHSNLVDFKDLCIVPGEKVWMLWTDIYVLDYVGDLIDAAGLAALAALMDVKLPVVEVKDGEVIKSDKLVPLKVCDYPVAVTVGKIKDYFIVDPSIEEEDLLDCRLTVVSTKDDDICALQKSFSGTFTRDEVLQAIELGVKKGKELRKLLLDSFEMYKSERVGDVNG